MERDLLKLSLRAGPSRRFDVCYFTRSIREAAEAGGEPATYLFSNKFLNDVILFKCVDHDDDPLHEGTRPVSTLVYLPYNIDQPAEGGKSFYFSPHNYFRYFDYRSRSGGDDLESDCNKLTLLDSVPTFSPFIVELAFQRADVPIPLSYLQLTPDLRIKLTGHLKGRLRPLIVAAFKDSTDNIEKAVEDLTAKLFCPRDLDDVLPLIEALRLPREMGQDVMASWLGIAYFEYEYALMQPKLQAFAKWLVKFSDPREPLGRADREYLTSLNSVVRQKIRGVWNEVVVISANYRSSYDDMVFRGKLEPFVEFLKNAEECYWRMGDVLGRLEQTISVWTHYARRANERRLPFILLIDMLSIMCQLHAKDGGVYEMSSAARRAELSGAAEAPPDSSAAA